MRNLEDRARAAYFRRFGNDALIPSIDVDETEGVVELYNINGVPGAYGIYGKEGDIPQELVSILEAALENPDFHVKQLLAEYRTDNIIVGEWCVAMLDTAVESLGDDPEFEAFILDLCEEGE